MEWKLNNLNVKYKQYIEINPNHKSCNFLIKVKSVIKEKKMYLIRWSADISDLLQIYQYHYICHLICADIKTVYSDYKA